MGVLDRASSLAPWRVKVTNTDTSGPNSPTTTDSPDVGNGLRVDLFEAGVFKFCWQRSFMKAKD